MWKDQLLGDKPDGEVIPVNKWLARMTLDVIGESMYASLSSVFLCLSPCPFIQLHSNSTLAH
jgi:hypothetical protein